MSTTVDPIVGLHPDNREEFYMGVKGIDESAAGFYFQLGTLDLNEEARKEIVYSDIRATSVNENLAPITFEVLVYAQTRDRMIDLAQQLELAVNNMEGGWFEYKPENTTGRSTYYRYEQSPIPTVRKAKINHWDTAQTRDEGKFVLMLQVELQSHPVGVSDPFSDPVFLFQTTFGDAVHQEEVEADKIDGDQPAFLIADLNNPAGSTKTLNRIYAFTRSGYLSNDTMDFFSFLTSDFDGSPDPSGAWSTPTPPERYGASVARLTPTALDDANYIDFLITPLEEHHGRISVFIAAKPSDDPDNWRIRSSFRIDTFTVLNNADRFAPEHEDKYHWVYCGDIDISDLLIPSVVDADEGNIRLTIDKIAGSLGEHIDVDAMLLVYQDESAMQVNVATDRSAGFPAEDVLRIDYLTDKAQRTVLHLDDANSLLGFAEAVFGSPAIELNPKFNTLVAFVGEGTTATDHMASSYVQFTTYASVIFRTIYPFGGYQES